MAYLLAAGIITCCFSLLGIGILFFGRKEISGECGSALIMRPMSVHQKPQEFVQTQTKDDALI